MKGGMDKGNPDLTLAEQLALARGEWRNRLVTGGHIDPSLARAASRTPAASPPPHGSSWSRSESAYDTDAAIAASLHEKTVWEPQPEPEPEPQPERQQSSSPHRPNPAAVAAAEAEKRARKPRRNEGPSPAWAFEKPLSDIFKANTVENRNKVGELLYKIITAIIADPGDDDKRCLRESNERISQLRSFTGVKLFMTSIGFAKGTRAGYPDWLFMNEPREDSVEMGRLQNAVKELERRLPELAVSMAKVPAKVPAPVPAKVAVPAKVPAKAAAEDKIALIMGVCDIEYGEATKLLERSKGNADEAINAHFSRQFSPSPAKGPVFAGSVLPEGYRVEGVSGDGNCLFRAIMKSHNIKEGLAGRYNREGLGDDHGWYQLRIDVVQDLSGPNVRLLYEQAYGVDLSPGESDVWEDIKTRHQGNVGPAYREFFGHQHNGNWVYGGHLEAASACRVLKRPISIWRSLTAGRPDWEHFDNVLDPVDQIKPRIFIVHGRHGSLHYETLVPTNGDYHTRPGG